MTTYSRSDVLSLWSIQESLLQSYRQIYISSQSILVSAAFVLVELQSQSAKASASRVLLVILGLITLVLWIRSATHRRKAVTYVQAQLLEIDSGGTVDNLYFQMQEYMNGRLNHPKSVDRFNELVASATQDVLVGKLIQALPLTFGAMWIYIGWAYWFA